MKRKGHRRVHPAVYGVYALLTAGIAWNAVRMFKPSEKPVAKAYEVQVNGNVEKPGVYRVPYGISQFEILKVAGVRPTSDLSSVNLSAQITADGELEVGQRNEPVRLNEESGKVVLEFYFGEVAVIAADGKTKGIREGIHIQVGDRVLTEARSQAEFSVNEYSKIDMDDFSELTFDKIGEQQQEKTVTEVFQRSGICWYKTAYAEKSDLFRVVTPLATISAAGTGGDFMVEVKYDEVKVHCIDGLLLAESMSGEETINLISGQSVNAFGDGRPFQVRSLAPDVNPSDRFSKLSKAKSDFILRQMPLNFIVYGIPNSYYMVSIRYDLSKATIIHLPGGMWVDQFVQGVSTLDEALLQGGPVLASTVVERLLQVKIPKYMVLRRDAVIRLAASLGEVSINVDPKAATYLGTRSGRQRLSGEQLIRFMSPAISGWEDGRRRQQTVLKGLFESFRTRSVVMTALLANQIVSGSETNFSSTDLMNEYGKFTSRDNWSYSLPVVPGMTSMKEGRTYFNPDPGEAAKILAGE